MKVLMISTPICTKCKSIAPKLEEYCRDKGIEYKYKLITDLDTEERQLLVESNVKQAPAFIVYLKDRTVVISGDDVMLELDTIYKNS